MTRKANPQKKRAPETLRAQALRLLARREYSRKELAARLVRFGANTKLAEDTVEKLEQEDLQSDQRFTESFIRANAALGRGPRRIEHDLLGHGINKDAAVQHVRCYCDWEEAAKRARIKRFSDSLPCNYAERAKQMRFLYMRGFSEEQTRRATESSENNQVVLPHTE